MAQGFLILFVLKSLLGIARQWSREKFAIFTLNPRSHVRIFDISNVGYCTDRSGGSSPSNKGGGGGGHPDPEIKGEGRSPKNIFSALRASDWDVNKGGGGGGGGSFPGSTTATVIGHSNCFGLVLRHSIKAALKTNEEVFTDKLL